MSTADLFGDAFVMPMRAERELCPGAMLLPGFALVVAPALCTGIEAVIALAPFRHLLTPGGLRMSVAMTNAGTLGWISDRRGYRYGPIDPETERPWPSMPSVFQELAASAAAHAGFAGFQPDACLINRYQSGARLTLHQDRDEHDYAQPIVSVSLGVPATFLFGGLKRSDTTQRIPLAHGDAVVWGGPARLRYHGVLPLKHGHHDAFDDARINLTFRRAGRWSRCIS